MGRRRRAEVLEEPVQRRLRIRRVSFAHMRVAVVIAGDSEDQSPVILIGFVSPTM